MDRNEIKQEILDNNEYLKQIHRHEDFIEKPLRLEDVIIHMKYAYSWANLRCYAKRRKVGSVLYKNGRPISSGFNGTPSGHPNKCEDKNGATLPTVIHAEENALYKLMEDNTDSPKNSSILVTTAPCPSCAIKLVAAKVSSVYFTEMYRSVEGVEELIKNGISVYHVNLKMVEDYFEKTEKSGDYNYTDFPPEFLTPIYLSSENNDLDEKIDAIIKIREMFENYEDGMYHKKYYDAAFGS